MIGWGVLLSALTVLLFQGTLSLLARALAPGLGANPEALTELVATGGPLLVNCGDAHTVWGISGDHHC
jgi:uncharacterized membrane protein YqgA involved in biofilm formation